MKQFQKLLFILLISSPFLASLHARELVDMLGRKVDIPEQPKKVYAPSPYGSYALYAMDPSLLVGWIFNIDSNFYPFLDKRMQTLPVVGRVFGAGQSANLEVLLAQHPDLIIMWKHNNAFTQKEEDRLKILSTPFVYALDENLLDYVKIFKFLGKALNKEERGNSLSKYTEKTFNDVKKTLSNIPKEKRPSVYYAEGADGLSTECDDSIHVELLQLAGDVNIHRCHTSSHKGFEKLSMERVLQYNPDIIFVQDQMFYDKVYKMDVWKNIKAVKEKKVFLIPKAPFNWFDRPPSFMRIMGLKWAMSKLYPDEYKVDIYKETKEFYKLFLNVDLTQKQLNNLLNRGDKIKRLSHYDKTAMGVNAPMYAYYAQKIKDTTGITKGVCLDVGSGGGYMGLALSKITDLDFIFLDISKEALIKADEHIKEYHLEKKAKTLLANVQDIPLADNSIDLVISRGSIPFWKDPAKGLSEIYRVLKVGGKAYVGGGKGSPEIRAAIDKKLQEMGKKPRMNKHKVHGDGMKRDYAKLLKSVGVNNFIIHKGDDGKWIEIWK